MQFELRAVDLYTPSMLSAFFNPNFFQCLFASQSLSSSQWQFLFFFFPPLPPPVPIHLLLPVSPPSTCLLSRNTKGERMKSERGGERERERNRWREKVCYKVPPWVEHGHLSWGWKLKKRLVNLYSWSPWDRGKNTAQQNTSRRTGTVRLHTHMHERPLR